MFPIVEVPSAQSAAMQHRHPGADVRARHPLPVEPRRPGHDRPVRVAEDDPRAHRDELVHEEQAALEHLLEDQHRRLAPAWRRSQRSRSGRPGRRATGRPRSSGSARRGRPGSRAPAPAARAGSSLDLDVDAEPLEDRAGSAARSSRLDAVDRDIAAGDGREADEARRPRCARARCATRRRRACRRR